MINGYATIITKSGWWSTFWCNKAELGADRDSQAIIALQHLGYIVDWAAATGISGGHRRAVSARFATESS
jgi:hypothetical protein